MLTVGTFAIIMFASVWGGGHPLEEASEMKPLPEFSTDFETSPVDMEAAISKFETLIRAVDQTSQIIIPLDESEENLMKTVQLLDDIIEAVQDPKNAEVFLKANGLTRIVAFNIDTENPEIKTKLIILIKVLFDVAPVTTKAYIPIEMLRTLLETFENGDVALKAHSLDVLAQWMPGNPKIQARVMRLKGLEAFYNQINKLDVSVIKVMLNLFIKILEEHLHVRGTNTEIDPEKYNLYRRIGLVERLSTAHVCIGFLNIFETLWSYTNINDDNHDVIIPVYLLIKNLQSCMNIYQRKTNAVSLFESLLKYIQDDTRRDYFEKMGLNATDFVDILSNSIHKIKSNKDEL